MKITLNAAEVKLAHYLGTQRNRRGKKPDITDAKVGPQDALQADIQGVGAEIAFCKVTNTYPDMGDNPGSLDAILHTGEFIDVKQTTLRTGRLLCRIGSGSDVDFYCLIIGELPIYHVAGFSTSGKLLKTEETIKSNKTHALKQKDLKDTIAEAFADE